MFLLEIPQVTDVSVSKLDTLMKTLIEYGVEGGKKILIACLIWFIGRYLVGLLTKLFDRVMKRHQVQKEVQSFLSSMVVAALNVLLIITVVSALGIETTSFAALLASAGVAIGMALSGQMQNFAGGVLILMQRPYKIGDYIQTNGVEGVVQSIQIFSTKILTVDNKCVIVPNGGISSSVLTNFSEEKLRRVDFSFGVEYGTDAEKVKAAIAEICAKNELIKKDPAPFVELGELADSSVNFTVRVWVDGADYWTVFFWMNQAIYAGFNERGIGFPFPQIVVHNGK